MEKRQKLSTTVSSESYAFLEAMVLSGQADSLARALDLVLMRVREAHNREQLERATAEYFEHLSPGAVEEENSLAEAFSAAAGEINLDE